MSNNTTNEVVNYHSGFNNHFTSTSALYPNALPIGQNNPLHCNYNLYTEQISGTSFTAPRHENKRSWMYRTLPSVVNNSYEWMKLESKEREEEEENEADFNPNPLRWYPASSSASSPNKSITFLKGLKKYATSDTHPSSKSGLSIYLYYFNLSSVNECFQNSDGDYLFVLQQGTLKFTTELGILIVEPKEIIVIPRGIVFSIEILLRNNLTSSSSLSFARGYILEIYKGHFELPQLGPIGANGLANPRDFQYPTANYNPNQDFSSYTHYNKFANQWYTKRTPNSPFNVVAWHGNYAPFKYNLTNFCTMNTVCFDHADPSIYTVLTCKSSSDTATSTPLADFVIFPPRWSVAENTFRPPYFHKNCMTEFMGMIYGKYDGKRQGFLPGGASLHSCMIPHGPDVQVYNKTIEGDEKINNKPIKLDGGLAFMFETDFMLKVTKYAIRCKERDLEYSSCWNGFVEGGK